MRLVATDLDGTLLRNDKTVSERTAATLRRLTAAGVHLALVTGRPLRWLTRVYDQVDMTVPAVCANGAVVYDPRRDEVLRAEPLAPELLAEVCRRLRAEIPGIVFAVEITDSREMRHEEEYEVWWHAEGRPVRALDDPAELCAVPAVKLLARAAGADTNTFAARVAACLDGIAEATHSSDHGLVEISAAGVTKAAGLAWLCQRLGVAAADVVAFGDMPNDVAMLAWAGRSVAVANAHPAVREVARDVTLTNEEDGVAVYIDDLLRRQPPAGADASSVPTRGQGRTAG
ncbi:MAG TPA: HAD family hydrolase [Pilimelia sp.]|nr:HAD family hydrolase [Pilimelia sp.]